MDLFIDWTDDSWQLMPGGSKSQFSNYKEFSPDYSTRNEDLVQGSEAGFCDAHVTGNLHLQGFDQSFLQNTTPTSFTDEELSMRATPGLAASSDLTALLAINQDASLNNGKSFDISEHHQPWSEVDKNQKSFLCFLCDVVSPSNAEYLRHLRSHGYICHQCNQNYSSHVHLGEHAERTGHNSYCCANCEATFSRFDVLKRHTLQHSAEPSKKYSCTHCKKWKAPNGFTRKDHLTQHLRNYHHIENTPEVPGEIWWWVSPTDLSFRRYCVHEGCSLYRTKEKAKEMRDNESLFPTRSAFTKHMREAHDRSTYPCTKTGCKKVGGKGFFRKRDLMKHMKREHDIDLMAEEDDTTAGPEVINTVSEAAISAPEIVSDGTESFDFQAFLAGEE